MPNIENEDVKQEKIVENLESISENTEETLELQKKELEEQKEETQKEEQAREDEKQKIEHEKTVADAEKRKDNAETAEKNEKKTPALSEQFKQAIDGIKTGLGYAGRVGGFLLSEGSGSGGFSQMAKDTFGLMSKGVDFIKDFAVNGEKPEGFKPVSFKDQLKSFFANRSEDKKDAESKEQSIENKTIQNIEETNQQVLKGASVDNSKQFHELRDDVKGTNGLLSGVVAKLSDILSLNKEWRIDDEVANRRKFKLDQVNPNNLGNNDLKDDGKKDNTNLSSALIGGATALAAGIASKIGKGLFKGGKGLFKGALKALLKTKAGRAAGVATLGAGALAKKVLPFLGKDSAKAGASEAGKAASKGGMFRKFKENLGLPKPADTAKGAEAVKSSENAAKKGSETAKSEASKPKPDAEKPKFTEKPKASKFGGLKNGLRKATKGGLVGGLLSAVLLASDVHAIDEDKTLTPEQKKNAKGNAALLSLAGMVGGGVGAAGAGIATGVFTGGIGAVPAGILGGVAGQMYAEKKMQEFIEAHPEAAAVMGEYVQKGQEKFQEMKEEQRKEYSRVVVDFDGFTGSTTYLEDLSPKEQEEYLKKHPETAERLLKDSRYAEMNGKSAMEVARKLMPQSASQMPEMKPADEKSKIADDLARETVVEKKKEEIEAQTKLAEKITEGQILVSGNKQPIIMDDHRITINNGGNGNNSNPFPIVMPTRDPAGMQVNGGY